MDLAVVDAVVVTDAADDPVDDLLEVEAEERPLTDMARGDGGIPVTNSRNCSENSLSPPVRMQMLSNPFSKN